MPETIIESVLNGKLDYSLLIKWLNNESIEDAPDDCILHCCTRTEFVAYFLTYLRCQTDSILQTNSNAVHILQNATPEKLLNTARKHQRSVSEPTSDERDTLSVKDSRSHHESPNRDKKRPGRRVKTKLFPDEKITNVSASSNASSEETRLSASVDRIAISTHRPVESTPSPIATRSYKENFERSDTPRFRHSRTHEKSCLGDYIVNATKSAKKKSKKNTSNDSEPEKLDLDLSNSEVFPEIGARKSNSLRSERKRIKPTNIDKNHKSLSLNSFNECFQSSLEDTPFKNQKFQTKDNTELELQTKESSNFEIERNLLKQERHKLMEKFNLNSTPAKSLTPHIKITQKESIEVTQNYVKGDVTKILMKERIDTLIEIYEMLLKNNLILSINTEIYFLISILVSKQLEDEYLNVEIELNNDNLLFLLKSIHNSTYFAVKSLWNQRVVLEVILDKNSLKTLGENKKVRSFYPELAKFLLNCYCVRCERPPARAAARAANVVSYNCETDNVDNFPSAQAAHLFKKQRDAFYDIVRWYRESSNNGGSRSSFRARVKALLSLGATAANHRHLATLVTRHMLQQCLPSDAHESKLSKLQRRLTSPALAAGPARLPHFTAAELFYKDLITHAENESFRVHLRDALASEIVSLDGTLLATEDTNSNVDLTREYLQLAKKLALLAKFLGYLTSLPYSQVPAEIASKNSSSVRVADHGRALNYAAPKERELETNVGLRNYSQPTIDLKGILHSADENYRLSITIPWLVHYLSMLDYTTLRLKYYNELLRIILEIYYNKLKLTKTNLKKNTIIYLKSILGWLFDLSHFPNDEISRLNSVGVCKNLDENSDGVDSCDLVDESTILELCPCLKEVNTLLSTCRLSQDNKDVGSFRHITPVSLSVDPEDRIKNKEKELQARLEEELLKSQPSSSRRALEMVVERVTAAAVRELTARELVAARERARELARRALASHDTHASSLQTMTSIYASQLQCFRAACLAAHAAPASSRARAALAALLPAAPRALHAAAARAALRALATWLQHHTADTTILCKDMEAEMRTLMSLNSVQAPPAAGEAPPPGPRASLRPVSLAEPLILLKEHICLMLDDECPPDVTSLLASCAPACAPDNACRRAPALRAMLQLTIDLCLVYVSRRPQDINDVLLAKFHAIWNICCPDRKHHAPENVSLQERRDNISPDLRNFEEEDRMPTPVSDEEIITNGIDKPQEIIVSQPITSTPVTSKPTSTSRPNTSTSKPNTSTSKPNTSTSQPTTPTSIASKWQPNNSKLLPINTKLPVNTRSQPGSPMLQPISTKWPSTSKSQPVSPKLQPIGCTWQPIASTPIKQPVIMQPIVSPWQPIALNLKQPIASPPAKQVNESEVYQSADSDLLECFDRILSPRNVMLLNASKCDKSEIWEAMAKVLVYLLKNDYLSEDSLTEQCLAVYRQDWPQSILESVSRCMKRVSHGWARSAGKFSLFLDFLADYCSDMEYEPVQQ